MLCKDIIKIIEQDYSPRYALSWDNVGLLAGRDDKEVANIYVALGCYREVVENGNFGRCRYAGDTSSFDF